MASHREDVIRKQYGFLNDDVAEQHLATYVANAPRLKVIVRFMQKRMRLNSIVPGLLVAYLFAPANHVLAETNSPQARIRMRTITVHSPAGFTLMPDEAKKIMLSEASVGCVVDVLKLADKWRATKRQASERIITALRVDKTNDPRVATVRVDGLDRVDAANVVNLLLFLLANGPVTGRPPTENDFKAIAPTNFAPDQLVVATSALGVTNTAPIEVIEYAK